MTDEDEEYMVSVDAVMIVHASSAEKAKQRAETTIDPKIADVEGAVNAVPIHEEES